MLFIPENIENLSRKERERLFKRMEILNAAVSLFAEKGYQHTTIDLIAEKAEFGKGTIYNYFRGKEEIYWAIIDDIFTLHLSTVNSIHESTKSFYEFLLKVTEEVFSFCLNNVHAFVMITRLRTNSTTQSYKIRESVVSYQTNVDLIFEQRVENAIKAKEISDLNVKSFNTLYRSMIFPYVYNQIFCEKNENIDVATESKFIINILFNGIKK